MAGRERGVREEGAAAAPRRGCSAKRARPAYLLLHTVLHAPVITEGRDTYVCTQNVAALQACVLLLMTLWHFFGNRGTTHFRFIITTDFDRISVFFESFQRGAPNSDVTLMMRPPPLHYCPLLQHQHNRFRLHPTHSWRPSILPTIAHLDAYWPQLPRRVVQTVYECARKPVTDDWIAGRGLEQQCACALCSDLENTAHLLGKVIVFIILRKYQRN